jgi:hypothetical protein
MRPESVFVALDALSLKKLPVTPDCVLSFREGYGQVGPVVVMPDSIIVEGARSVLSMFTSWKTSRREFPNLRSPVDSDLPLADPTPYLLSFSHSTVRVMFDVQPFAEKTFSGLPVEVLSVTPNREVILIPPRIEIVVRGGIDQLSALTLEDFRASIEYRSVLSDTTGTLEAEISAPAGVHIVRRQPEHIQYIIRTRL